MSAETTFGQLVKTHREKLGLTQKELAHGVGCAPVTLRKIEYNDLRPSVQIAEGLATALKISPEERAAFVELARGQGSPLSKSLLSPEETDTDERRRVTTHENIFTVTDSSYTLTDADNPYKGLRAFEESDTADFFGRETLIQQLLASMGESGDLARFLAVVGPSGSGKSSVVKAGLIPALKSGGLPGSENWLFVEIVPGSNPLEELEVALSQLSGNAHLSLIEELQKDTLGLLRAVNHYLPNDPTIELLIVIDQFEELFTLVQDEAIRAHLLHNLMNAALDQRSRVHIVLTLRADFLDRSLSYVDFGELISQRIEFVLPLMQDELERAILGPAERVGLQIDAGVVSAIIHDLGDQPGTLPLLQYALTELFDKRDGNVVTKFTYQSIGGVLGALGRHAEEVFIGLDKTSQNTARQLFLRLVTLGEGVEDTRRRALRSELESLTKQEKKANRNDSKKVDLVLDAFGKARLLAFDRDMLTREPTVEIAHEALIRNWDRLRDWLAESREDLRIQRQLTMGAKEWANARRDPSFLATGARLMRFEVLAMESNLALTDEERVYLNTSVTEYEHGERERRAQRRRVLNLQRWVIGILIIFLLVAAGLTRYAFIQRDGALTQADIAFSRQLAAQAFAEVQKPLGNDEFATLLAIRSLKIQYDPIADAALVEAAGKLPLKVLSGHTDEIRSVAYSPDGKYVLTGSADTTIKLWNVVTGDPVRTFKGHTAEITSVAFSPDGRYICSASEDTTAKVWNLTTGEEVYTLSGNHDVVLNVAFSPDGNYILTTTDLGGVAKLWDTARGHEVWAFGRGELGNGAAFSPDGQYIISNSNQNDYFVKIWEVSTGLAVHTLRGHSNWVYSVAFSPDGKYALTGSADNTAKLWEVATGKEVYTLKGHSNSVRSVAFSPDGKYILTGSGDRTARLWDVATGQEVRSWRGHFHRVLSVAFSPDGRYIVTGSADGTAKMWDFAIGEGRILKSHSDEVYSVAFSPDGKYALTSSLDQTVKLWDINTNKEIRTFSVHEGLVFSVTFSSDARYLLTGSEEGMAQIWDIATGQEIHRFSGHTGSVFAAAFSPDGTYVLTGSLDNTAKLWEASTGRELRTFSGHKAGVLSVAFSPDGVYAVTASDDGTARVWEIDSGQVVGIFQGTDIVFAVAFSPDGKNLLASNGDGTAQLWDVATGKEILILTGHTNSVYDVAFSPDGRYAVTASADRTAKVWDIATGEELRTLSGHGSAIWSATFSPNGKYILTGSFDGTARLWDVDYRDFVAEVCAHLLRDFTEEERIQAHIEDQEPTCP